MKQACDIGADAGPDSERRRENAAGHAADRGEGGGEELEHAEILRQWRAGLQRRLHLRIAGPVDRVARGEAAQRNRKSAGQREQQRLPPDGATDGAWQPAGHRDQDPAEQAASGAADDAAKRHCEPIDALAERNRSRAEIGVVAHQRERGQTGSDHGGDDEAGGARLVGATHLLDAEHDAGKRRVEGGGDASCGAGQDQSGLASWRQPAQRKHDRGADLHRRPFAADRAAAQQAEQGQHDLADGDADRDQRTPRPRIRQVPRGDRLRDAAPLRVGKVALGQIDRQREAGGRDDQRRVARPRQQPIKGKLGLIGEHRQRHRRRAHDQPACNEQDPPLPPRRGQLQPTLAAGCDCQHRGASPVFTQVQHPRRKSTGGPARSSARSRLRHIRPMHTIRAAGPSTGTRR